MTDPKRDREQEALAEVLNEIWDGNRGSIRKAILAYGRAVRKADKEAVRDWSYREYQVGHLGQEAAAAIEALEKP